MISDMKDILLQFHATSQEIADLSYQWLVGGVKATGLNIRPFKLEPIGKDSMKNSVLNNKYSRIIFSDAFIDLSVSNSYELADKHKDLIYIHLGKMLNGKLEESSISGRFENDSDKYQFWKNRVNQFRKNTKNSVKATGLNGNNSVEIKNNRYTRGAYEFFANGGVILPCAGNSILTFEDPFL